MNKKRKLRDDDSGDEYDEDDDDDDSTSPLSYTYTNCDSCEILQEDRKSTRLNSSHSIASAILTYRSFDLISQLLLKKRRK